MSAIPLAFRGKLKNINMKRFEECFPPASGDARTRGEQQRPLHLEPLWSLSQAAAGRGEPLNCNYCCFQLLVGTAGEAGEG